MGTRERTRARDLMRASVRVPRQAAGSALSGNRILVEARFPDGRIEHRSGPNLVVNVGLDDTLDQYFRGVAYTAAWFVGLTDGSPTVAPTDTMASHPGWTEITQYDEADRQIVSFSAPSGQQIDNFASPAVFTIASGGNVTVGGGFTVNDNTRGGTAGTLYNAVAFVEGDLLLTPGSQLTVRCAYTQAAA